MEHHRLGNPMDSKTLIQLRCLFLALGRKWIRGKGVNRLLRKSLALPPRTPISLQHKAKTSTRWVIRLQQLLTWWTSIVARMYLTTWTRAKEAQRDSITTTLWKANNRQMHVKQVKTQEVAKLIPIRWSHNHSWPIPRILTKELKEGQMVLEVFKLVQPIPVKQQETRTAIKLFILTKVKKHHFRTLNTSKLLSQALFALPLPCATNSSKTTIWRLRTTMLRTLRSKELQLIIATPITNQWRLLASSICHLLIT